ncbi:MAG TPA: protease inhibitor I42 family protein [Vicinamibacterales bacterium]|nr:protease inhibitor I42 family protein [Vicinamibacterales bacterium]
MSDLTLTEADAGRRVAVRVGDIISIQLPEHAGGGYQWTASHVDDGFVDVARKGYETVNPSVGSGGIAVWIVTAEHPGSARVELIESRSWEQPAQPIHRFAITLDISHP